MVTVGFETIAQLAMATATLDTLGNRRQPVLDDADFWLHALGAAKAAQLLADSSPVVADSAVCFTGGLLHDVGKYVLALALGKEYGPVASSAKEEEVALHKVESRVLGTTHASVGAWLMTQWGLPPLVVAAIEYQDHPDRYEGPNKAAVAAISLCSDLARECGLGYAGDHQPPQYEPEGLCLLGIDKDTVHEVREHLADMRQEARAALNLLRCAEESG